MLVAMKSENVGCSLTLWHGALLGFAGGEGCLCSLISMGIYSCYQISGMEPRALTSKQVLWQKRPSCFNLSTACCSFSSTLGLFTTEMFVAFYHVASSHIIRHLHKHLLFLQERFTQDTQPHYIYSPREMTRWVRGIFEALRPLETLPVEGLIRIWAHEALRLFQDR